ncbi:MAG: OB-fold domain-containing protein [Acidimicrobiales bacterium]|nr:OB-fold domain-containing protein [Acidimicrobiales bacterium]
MTQVAFAPDVFTWPSDAPQLIGGRCPGCAAVAFPLPTACPRCGSTDVERHLLPRRGTLYTWTTQDFLPKEPYASGETPDTFRPYGVGLVQLGDEVRVEARLTESDPRLLDFGMEVELAIVPFRTDDDGTEVMTYAFTPVQGPGAE